MKKIEHLGIAVKNIDASIKIYESLLNTPCYKLEEVESEGVKTAFFQLGESKIELLEATRLFPMEVILPSFISIEVLFSTCPFPICTVPFFIKIGDVCFFAG